jgi:hypothetical protein
MVANSELELPSSGPSRCGGGLVGLAWGFVALRMALRKTYSGFRVALVPVATPA